MTSKLRRTIVGVGIALGSAAPACFGRTEAPPGDERDDGATVERPDARAPDAGTPDARTPDDAGLMDRAVPEPDGSVVVPDASSDAATDGFVDPPDASSDAMDPFCDVSWPPTKGNPEPGRVPCVDPLNECKDAWPPWRCYALLDPLTCDPERERVGPLYCIGGQWHCGPGSDDGSRCRCFGPLPEGKTCTDAGVAGAGGTGGSGGTGGAEGGARAE